MSDRLEQLTSFLQTRGLDRSKVEMHRHTLFLIAKNADGELPVTVTHTPVRFDLRFECEDNDRAVRVSFSKLASTDVTVSLGCYPEPLRASNQSIFTAFAWLREGRVRSNKNKQVICGIQEQFRPPFVCFQCAEPDTPSEFIEIDLVHGDTLKRIYDQFRRQKPEGTFILYVNARHLPNLDDKRFAVGTVMLEKAFYYGDVADTARGRRRHKFARKGGAR